MGGNGSSCFGKVFFLFNFFDFSLIPRGISLFISSPEKINQSIKQKTKNRILQIADPADTNNVFQQAPYGLRKIAVGTDHDDPRFLFFFFFFALLCSFFFFFFFSHLYLNERAFYRGCFRTTLLATHFSVTIVWNDPPATRGSGFGLVNNLDLAIMTVTGDQVFLFLFSFLFLFPSWFLT